MRSAAVEDRSLPEASEPHETRANSVLRPIVFGASDGLVSNLTLVMGVAGATSDNGIIVLAGERRGKRKGNCWAATGGLH